MRFLINKTQIFCYSNGCSLSFTVFCLVISMAGAACSLFVVMICSVCCMSVVTHCKTSSIVYDRSFETMLSSLSDSSSISDRVSLQRSFCSDLSHPMRIAEFSFRKNRMVKKIFTSTTNARNTKVRTTCWLWMW